MNCRFCAAKLEFTLLDLGFAPPSNAYISAADLDKPECTYPLKVKVCTSCWLVQTEDYLGPADVFLANYAYFSSTSPGWLAHAGQYATSIIDRLRLNSRSLVIEVGCNDGYLLRNFLKDGIPCLGIEPTESTAAVARRSGIEVIEAFFTASLGQQLARDNKQADLIAGNNVYAHVIDINDFTRGLKAALKPNGTITLEFPHLLHLIEETQFDTIYHEHFSYLSLHTSLSIFEKAGLRVFDVEELATHGGSLRLFGCHADDPRSTTRHVSTMLATEISHGLQKLETYCQFQSGAERISRDLYNFLVTMKREGKQVIAYGAAAKGNTLLNYAGVLPDLLPMVCDAAPSKQGMYLPGSHIPIVKPEILAEIKPDIVLVLAWNIIDEVASQHSYISQWGGRFATAVPGISVLEPGR